MSAEKTVSENDAEKGPSQGTSGLNLDVVIEEIGGLSRYQWLNGFAVCVPVTLSTAILLNFVFSAMILDYRCLISECENTETATFNPYWLSEAVPYRNGRPEKCFRYNGTGEMMSNRNRYITNETSEDTCLTQDFNHSSIVGCEQFLIKNNEFRLAKHFNLLCTPNEYRLALVGVANNFGRFVAMPISGLLSDRYGRLSYIVCGSVAASIFGIIQAYSFSLEMYMVMEFLTALASSGILTACFILSAEWVTTKHRVLMSSIIGLGNPSGATFLSLSAMFFSNDFRTFQLVIFLPGILILAFIWLLEESPRWLVATGRNDRAVNNLTRVAHFNGRNLSVQTKELIQTKKPNTSKIATNELSQFQLIFTVFKIRKLLLRLIALSFVWIAASFVYYGIIMGSTQIHDNKYMSFLLVGWAEMPGAIALYFIRDRLGRRSTVGGSMFLCGCLVIGSTMVTGLPNEHIYKLLLYILGKATITASFITLYTYTTELWPTQMRNTFMCICSMIGRIGGMLASLMVLLDETHPRLPAALFGMTSVAAALVIWFFLPETLNKKLPDTIEESSNIDNKSSTN